MHTLLFPDLRPDAALLTIGGEEAHHAIKVKRVSDGERVRVMSGRGVVAVCEVARAKKDLELRVLEAHSVPRVRPEVHVWSATPKGPRVDALVDGLVQVGAASWTPMATRLGVVDPRETKVQRLHRVALEAAKQAQRPWLMEIREKASFEAALAPAPGETVVLADARGPALATSGIGPPAPRPDAIRLLIGPEGGWTEDERTAARTAGARACCLGPHTMRIETAAPVGAALLLAIFGASACNPEAASPQEPTP